MSRSCFLTSPILQFNTTDIRAVKVDTSLLLQVEDYITTRVANVHYTDYDEYMCSRTPLYSGHPWGTTFWPLYRGDLY